MSLLRSFTTMNGLLLTMAVIGALIPPSANADKPDIASSQYVRITYDPQTKEPLALQTAIEHLVVKDSLGTFNIDLVSAVHIGERSYYEELNRRFKQYDAVLFELVADPDVDRERIGEPSDNVLSLGQKALQNILGLSFQLEQIDYKASNFVHADMSPDQFSQSMKNRGESVSELLLSMMLRSIASGEGSVPPNVSDLLMMAFSQHRTIGFRRSLARQFGNMDSMLSAINGPEGSTLVTERNKVAIEVAKFQRALGKKSLAIFYGGAHMPDMKQRIKEGFSRSASNSEDSKSEWLTSWNLTAKTD